MSRYGILPLLLLFAAGCVRPAPPPSPMPAGDAPRGVLQIVVEPNPIVAIPVEGDTWQFPITLRIRELGGADVEIERVGVDVFAVAGLKVYSTTLDQGDIDARGFTRRLPANGEIRYRITPRQKIPDARLFSSVVAELWVEGTDARGATPSTRTRVSVVAQ
jgi:hypothetical protein